VSNNLLKYVASTIFPWMDMLASHLKTGYYIISMMDSSISAGWLRETNFWKITREDVDPVQSKVRIKTAQHHATLFLKEGITEYSQWFPDKLTTLPMLSCATLIKLMTN
jgi:hypothetical protein